MVSMNNSGRYKHKYHVKNIVGTLWMVLNYYGICCNNDVMMKRVYKRVLTAVKKVTGPDPPTRRDQNNPATAQWQPLAGLGLYLLFTRSFLTSLSIISVTQQVMWL